MPSVPLPISEFIPAPPPRKRFTRDEVEQMTASGMFSGQRFELIDGDLIDKMGQNPPHSFALQMLVEWLAGFLGIKLIRMQLPMQAAGKDSERSLPEPDVAVLRERKPEYARRHPTGPEVLLVAEVSDTSATFDRTRKAALYARAGVPEYWVLDLAQRVLLVHRSPSGDTYGQIEMYSPEESIAFPGRADSIAVSSLLPPA